MIQEMRANNELIANFMNWQHHEDPKYHNHEMANLKYHFDWNWLMPVVEKIESIQDEHHGYFGVHISSNSCSIQGTNLWKAIEPNSKYGAVYMSDPNAILSTKIESTYYNVVEFIKWYNLQSQ